jgi:ABC-2 type transport system permease protein
VTTATSTATTATDPLPGRGTGRVLAGTGTLLRFALRRDRIRLPVWIGALFLLTVSSVSSFETSYPEREDRLSIKETLEGPGGLAMSGPERYLSGDYDFGAMTGHQMMGFMGILVGIMSVLTMVRHTRAEEETGRAELVRAAVVGRHAPLTAALTVAIGANLLLAALLAAGLGSTGAEGVTTSGSLLYGATSAAIGISFAAIAAVTTQITPFSRGASGLGMAAIGVAFTLRAVGDVGAAVFSWLSPIGWAQRTYVYVDDRWWPLLLNAALIAGAVAAAFVLSTRRDVGAGLRPPRPGRPRASDALTRPLGFAVRLHRAVLIGFGLGAMMFGVMYGSILGDAEELMENNDQFQETAQQLGGDMVETFAAVVMSLLAVVAAVYVVMGMLRPRAEETGGRAEPVLATGLSRTRWLVSHLCVTLAGGTLIMMLAGLGFGVAGAASADDTGLVVELIGASLAYVPALWTTAGVALVLFGWLPRASAVAWIVPGYAFFVVFLGELTGLPDGLRNLSPIGQVPQVPAAELEWTPLLVMTALAVALCWLGLAGFRRRDLETK